MKKLTGFCMLLVLVLCLWGCAGKGNKGTGKVTEKPEEKPTTEPSNTPTPTLKVPEVFEGPSFVFGTSEDDSMYSTLSTRPDRLAFLSSVDYIYLTEPGYEKLAETLKAHNTESFRRGKQMLEQVSEWQETVTEKYDDAWYYYDSITPCRNDSLVFSFIRTTRTFMGGLTEARSTGYSYDTNTGALLELADIIRNISRLEELIIKDLGNQFANPEEVFLDDWKLTVSQILLQGKLVWVAVDDGIQYRIPAGEIAARSRGEIEGTIRIRSNPEVFTEKYIGAYEGFEKKAREDRVDPKEALSPLYDRIIPTLVDGIGSMSYAEATLYLDSTDLSYNFVSPDELVESNPEIEFYDPQNGDKIYMMFWPADLKKQDAPWTLSIMYISPFKLDGFLLADDTYHEKKPEIRIIDRSFPKKDGIITQRTVSFERLEDAMAVLTQGFYLYYPELYPNGR